MVEVSVGWGGELQGAEADIVERLVIDAVGFIGVLHQLMHGQGGVVGLHNGVGHLGRGHNGKGVHDPVGILLSDLADEKGSHAGACAASQGVGQLEALQTVTGLRLFSHHVEHGVNQLRSLCVVTLGPVVASSALSC